MELHREFLKRPMDRFSGTIANVLGIYRDGILTGLEFNQVFDVLQIIRRHQECPPNFTATVKEIFEHRQLAYYVDTNGPPTIFPISTGQEGEAISDAIRTFRASGLAGAEAHLRKAGELINQGDWAGSIRESIHSVESIASKLVPNASNSLAAAMKVLEKNYPLHGAFRMGILNLYGYTSNEQGIRHALIDRPDSPAGRDEAVFMLGACASFASYLWRITQGSN